MPLVLKMKIILYIILYIEQFSISYSNTTLKPDTLSLIKDDNGHAKITC